jgi:hypothetical protein
MMSRSYSGLEGGMRLKPKVRKRYGRQPAGFIMCLTLGFAVLLSLAGMVAIGPSVGELLKSGQELRDKRLFFRADGGAALCRAELKNRLNLAMPTKLSGITDFASFDTRYVAANDPALFFVENAYDIANPTLKGGSWIKDSTTQVHVEPSFGPYQCRLTVTARSAPTGQLSGLGSKALFRYRYTASGTGKEGDVTRTVSLEGSFSVLVQQENFARYALFTNTQGGVYFAQGSNYYGPVHTNGQFNFMQNPGTHFWDSIESVSPTATYGNSPSSPIQLAADHNGTIDVPIFDQGLTLGAANIPMPATSTGDTQKGIALRGLSGSTDTSAWASGVYLGYSGTAMQGGIYVKGDASIGLNVQTGSVAQYAITQGSNTWTVQIYNATNQTSIKKNTGSPTTYSGLPNGMLFVDGNVTSLAGTLERNTQLTVAATNNVTITGNLMYENYTAGSPPNADNATNLMGIISWNNSIHIGTTAPNNVTIHATLMAPVGQVLVDSFDDTARGPRGTATVLGGVIQDSYGAFALSSGGSLISGYARNFVYDKRMSRGMAPPYFPTTGKVVRTLNGITDRPNWRQTS